MSLAITGNTLNSAIAVNAGTLLLTFANAFHASGTSGNTTFTAYIDASTSNVFATWSIAAATQSTAVTLTLTAAPLLQTNNINVAMATGTFVSNAASTNMSMGLMPITRLPTLIGGSQSGYGTLSGTASSTSPQLLFDASPGGYDSVNYNEPINAASGNGPGNIFTIRCTETTGTTIHWVSINDQKAVPVIGASGAPAIQSFQWGNNADGITKVSAWCTDTSFGTLTGSAVACGITSRRS